MRTLIAALFATALFATHAGATETIVNGGGPLITAKNTTTYSAATGPTDDFYCGTGSKGIEKNSGGGMVCEPGEKSGHFVPKKMADATGAGFSSKEELKKDE